jgi:hypothetical protein
MQDVFCSCFAPKGEIKPSYEFWDYIPNISDFFGKVPRLHGITKFRQILVSKNADSDIIAQFREHAGGPEENFGGLTDRESEVVILARDDIRRPSAHSVPPCQLTKTDPSTLALIKRDVTHAMTARRLGNADKRDLTDLVALIEHNPDDPVACPWGDEDYRLYDASWRAAVSRPPTHQPRIKNSDMRVGSVYMIKPDPTANVEFFLGEAIEVGLLDNAQHLYARIQWYEKSNSGKYTKLQAIDDVYEASIQVRIHVLANGHIRPADIAVIDGFLRRWRISNDYIKNPYVFDSVLPKRGR